MPIQNVGSSRYSSFTTAAPAWSARTALEPERQWLAGDSHIHSHWSANDDATKNPPEPIVGVDGQQGAGHVENPLAAPTYS